MTLDQERFAVRIMTSMILFSSLGLNLGLTFQPLLANHLGIESVEIGLLLSIMSGVSAFMRFPAGTLSDRYGRKKILLLGEVLGVSASILFTLPNIRNYIVLPFVLWGVSIGLYYTVENVLVADYVSQEYRIKAYTITYLAYFPGLIAGPFLGGIITEQFGIGASFLVPTLSLAVGTITILKLPNRIVDKEKEKPSIVQNVKNVLTGETGKVVRTFSLLFLMYGIHNGLYVAITPVFFKNEYDISYFHVGVISAIGSIGNAIGIYLNPRVKVTAFKKMILLSTWVSSLWPLAYLSTRNLSLIILISAISGLSSSFGIWSPLSNMFLDDHLPAYLRGMAWGIVGTFWRMGMVIGSIIMGMVWQQFGLTTIFYIASGFLFVGGFLVLLTMSKK